MTGGGFDADESRSGARLTGLKLRGEFEAVARDNTIVGVGGRDHRRGILHSAFDVVIRGVLQQGREFFRDIGTAKVIRPETEPKPKPTPCKLIG